MESGTARVTHDADSDPCSGPPAAGLRARAGMFVLSAAAGLALASGAAAGPSAARAAVAVSARAAVTVQSHPAFVFCPCDKPVCRPACLRSGAPWRLRLHGAPAHGPGRARCPARPPFDHCFRALGPVQRSLSTGERSNGSTRSHSSRATRRRP